jgi:hypothetical protein
MYPVCSVTHVPGLYLWIPLTPTLSPGDSQREDEDLAGGEGAGMRLRRESKSLLFPVRSARG